MTPTPNERSTRVSSRDASTARWVGSAGAAAVAAAGAGPGTMGPRCLAGCATSSRWPPRKSALPDSRRAISGRSSGRAERAATVAGAVGAGGVEGALFSTASSSASWRRSARRRRGSSGASARLASRLATAAAAEAPAMGGRPETTRSGEPMFVSAGGWTTTKIRAFPGNARRRASSRRRTARRGLRRLRGRHPRTTLVRERKSRNARKARTSRATPRDSRRSGSRRG